MVSSRSPTSCSSTFVGYSKFPINRQSELLQQLNQITRATEQFRHAEAADKLVRLPTGDGMSLAFFTSPDAPVRCAIEVSKAVGQVLQPAGEKGRQAGALALQALSIIVLPESPLANDR